MNKFYLLAIPMAICATVSAQHTGLEKISAKRALERNQDHSRSSTFIPSSRAGGTVVWTEDFANGLTGNNPSGAWSTSGPNGGLWMYDTDGPNGYFSSPTTEIIQSSTQGNGFMIFDGDYANNSGDPLLANNGMQWQGDLVSPVIDLSTTPCVSLSYSEVLRWCCYGGSEFYLDVTINGFGSYTTFDAKDPDLSTGTYVGTTERSFNITDAIAASPSTVQFRFRWGEVGNSLNASHYFWQLDDIAIVENFDYDHVVDTLVFGASTNYYLFSEIPQNHLLGFEVGGTVNNQGCASSTNVSIGVDDFTGSLATTNAEASLSPSASTASLYATAGPSWTSGATFELKAYPNSDQTEEVTDNDTLSFPIEITSASCGTFACHGSTVEEILSGTNFPSAYSNGAGYGAYHEMQVDDTVSGVWIAVTDSSINYGALVQVQVWVNDGGGNQMISSYDTQLPSSNLGTYVYLHLPTAYQVPVNAGDVVIAVVRDFSGEIRVFGGGNTGNTACLGAMWEYDAAGVPTEYLSSKAPFISMQMGTCAYLGVDEFQAIPCTVEQNMPNPFNVNSTVLFGLNVASNLEFEIRDVTGKLISYQDLGHKLPGKHEVTIDGSQLSSGVYFYSVIADGIPVTKRMTVTK